MRYRKCFDNNMKYATVLVTFLIHVSHTQPPSFWNPRLSIDVNLKDSNQGETSYPPTAENMKHGYVIVIEGFHFAAMLVQLCADNIYDNHMYVVDPPLSVGFYNEAYRWALRHFTLLPEWLKGRESYAESQQAWKLRFYYRDKFVPSWLTYLLPTYQAHEEWDKTQEKYKLYLKHAAKEFLPYYKYPELAP